MPRSFRVRVALITLGGAILRVALVLLTRRHATVWGDAVSYHQGANLLADGKGFIDPLRYLFAGVSTPSAYHPPLYTVYLAMWSFVGVDGPLGHRIVSAIVGSTVVALAALLGRRISGERAGLWAAVFAALYPALWMNDIALLSECVVAPMVLLVLLGWHRWRATPDWKHAAVLGGAIGLAMLGRAELALLGLAFVVVAFVRKDVRSAAAIAVAAGLVAGPWMLYNLMRFEKPVTLSTGLGATLSGGACDDAFSGKLLGYWTYCGDPNALPEPTTPVHSKAEIRAYLQKVLPGEPDESAREAKARKVAIDYLRDHVGELVTKVIPARVGRIWNVYRPLQNATLDAEVEGRGQLPAYLALAAYWLLMPLALLGLLVLRRRKEPIWPYLLLVAFVTLTAAMTFAVPRYRVPVDALLPVLAGVALAHWPARSWALPEPAPEPDPA